MIGEIEGVQPGHFFPNRRSLHDAGVHRALQKGIGAAGESIVLSGGYIDDIDEGDIIIYTGEGGRDQRTGRQVADQTMTRGNLALSRHYQEGNPIRVCRGSTLDSPHAPQSGYTYAGLYRIENCWNEVGTDGFLIWRYPLVKIPSAESCHIRPVGRPHNGPDIVENILCLSPNMHALFDLGAISLTDDLQVLGINGNLNMHPQHHLSIDCIRCHREHIFRRGAND